MWAAKHCSILFNRGLGVFSRVRVEIVDYLYFFIVLLGRKNYSPEFSRNVTTLLSKQTSGANLRGRILGCFGINQNSHSLTLVKLNCYPPSVLLNLDKSENP